MNDKCKYCGVKILEGQSANWEDELPVCMNCGVTDKEKETVAATETTEERPDDAIKWLSEQASLPYIQELQWVRLKQVESGETDAVILKRNLLEIATIMKMYSEAAQNNFVVLNPEAYMRARFALANAVTMGFAYLQMHPSNANGE